MLTTLFRLFFLRCHPWHHLFWPRILHIKSYSGIIVLHQQLLCTQKIYSIKTYIIDGSHINPSLFRIVYQIYFLHNYNKLNSSLVNILNHVPWCIIPFPMTIVLHVVSWLVVNRASFSVVKTCQSCKDKKFNKCARYLINIPAISGRFLTFKTIFQICTLQFFTDAQI